MQYPAKRCFCSNSGWTGLSERLEARTQEARISDSTMNLNNLLFTGLVAAATLGLSADAVSDGRNPGSLLLYPEFDNRAGDVTVLTVTNTTASEVDVEFVYIGVEGAGGSREQE